MKDLVVDSTDESSDWIKNTNSNGKLMNKIEIDLGLLQKGKTRKRVWVKPTATKKGYYREQEVGQKEIERKPPRKDTGKIASLPDDMKKEILDLRRLGDSGAKIKGSIENMFDMDPDLRDKFVESGILTLKTGSASLNVTGQSLVDWAKARGVESRKKRKTVKVVEEKAKEIEETRFKEANEKLARLQTDNKQLKDQLDREKKSSKESNEIREKLRNENYILRQKLKGLGKPDKETDNKKLVSQYLSGVEHASRHLKSAKMEKSDGSGRLQIEIDLGIFNKAQDEGVSASRPGLVKKKVTVKRGGKTFQQYRWVKAGAEEPTETKPSVEEPAPVPKKELVIVGLNKPEAKPEESDFAAGLKKGMTINFKGEDKKIKFFNPDVKTVTFVGDDTNYTFEEVNKYGKEPEGEIEVRKPVAEKPEVAKGEMSPGNVISLKSLGDMDIEGGINEGDSHIVKFKDGSNAIYKTTGTIATQGEVNVRIIESILGWNNAPETVVGDFGKGEGSCQKWVSNVVDLEAQKDWGEKGAKIEEKHFDDLSKIFLVDLITGNFDRHANNIKLDKEGKIWAIDNDSWGTKSDYSTVLDDDFSMCVMSNWMDNVGTEEQRDVLQKYVTKNVKEIVKRKQEITDHIKSLGKHGGGFKADYQKQSKEMEGELDIYNKPKSLKEAVSNMMSNLEVVVAHESDYKHWYGSS